MTRPPVPERDFVARIRAGDPEALAELYDRYAKDIYRIGLQLIGHAADAEDMVHDVFVGLPSAVRTYEGRGPFKAWLKQVATRAALMKLRLRKRTREVSLRRAPVLSPEPVLVERLDLQAALDALVPEHRIVFVLREVQGYSHDEIARFLGISVGASKARLYRARRKLRTFLEDS